MKKEVRPRRVMSVVLPRAFFRLTVSPFAPEDDQGRNGELFLKMDLPDLQYTSCQRARSVYIYVCRYADTVSAQVEECVDLRDA